MKGMWENEPFSFSLESSCQMRQKASILFFRSLIFAVFTLECQTDGNRPVKEKASALFLNKSWSNKSSNCFLLIWPYSYPLNRFENISAYISHGQVRPLSGSLEPDRRDMSSFSIFIASFNEEAWFALKSQVMGQEWNSLHLSLNVVFLSSLSEYRGVCTVTEVGNNLKITPEGRSKVTDTPHSFFFLQLDLVTLFFHVFLVFFFIMLFLVGKCNWFCLLLSGYVISKTQEALRFGFLVVVWGSFWCRHSSLQTLL